MTGMRPVTMWATAGLSVVAILVSNQAGTASGGEQAGFPEGAQRGVVAEQEGSAEPPVDAPPERPGDPTGRGARPGQG